VYIVIGVRSKVQLTVRNSLTCSVV